jgi:hypothetical protein
MSRLWQILRMNWMATVVGAIMVAAIVVAPSSIPRWEPIPPPTGKLPDALEGDDSVHRCIGHKKADIIAKFGPPSAEWKGGFGSIHSRHFWERYGACITLLYERRRAGGFYLLFREQDGEWLCLGGSWLAKGWVF